MSSLTMFLVMRSHARHAEANTFSTQKEAKSELSLWKTWTVWQVSHFDLRLCLKGSHSNELALAVGTRCRNVFWQVSHKECTAQPLDVSWLTRWKTSCNCWVFKPHLYLNLMATFQSADFSILKLLVWLFLCTCCSDYLSPVFLVSLGCSYFTSNHQHSPPCPISCHDYFVTYYSWALNAEKNECRVFSTSTSDAEDIAITALNQPVITLAKIY